MGKKQKKHSTKPADSKDTKKMHPGYWDSLQMKLFTPEMLLIAIVMCALVLRLLYLKQMTATPLFHGLVVDADKFDGLALKILGGDFTHKEFIYLNPLYPFFLALIYFIGGHSQFSVLCTQAVIDSLSCILLYYCAATLFNKAVGIIAAITYACYGLAIFYTGTLLAPTLVIFLSLAFIASLLPGEKRKPYAFFISGILFGLVVAARPNVILFLFFLPLWFFTALKNKLGISRSMRRLSLFLVGFLAVMSLITIRNYSIEKSFSPFSVQGGINFYIGNNPEATGTFMTPHGLSSSPIEQVKTSIRYAEKQLGRTLTPSQASRYWLSQGLTFITNNPLDAFSLYLTKCAFFWRKEELPLNVDYSLSRTFLPIFRLPFITFGYHSALCTPRHYPLPQKKNRDTARAAFYGFPGTVRHHLLRHCTLPHAYRTVSYHLLILCTLFFRGNAPRKGDKRGNHLRHHPHRVFYRDKLRFHLLYPSFPCETLQQSRDGVQQTGKAG